MAMAMSSCSAVTISGGGSHVKLPCGLWTTRSSTLGNSSMLTFQRKPIQQGKIRKLSVSAEYKDGGRGGGDEFLAGFILGGAVFGTLAYVFAPQIRRSILNEDENGFRKARQAIYYDEDESGLEKTRRTLNAKISQLNSAIDKVSSRLRGGNKESTEPIPTDSEVETTT